MSLEDLVSLFGENNYVVGLKQTLINLTGDNCEMILLATDSDDEFKQKICGAADGKHVKILEIFSCEKLGKMAGIAVKAGVIAKLRNASL